MSNQVCLNSHTNAPLSFISIWRFHVAMISRPWESRVRIVLSINLPVSFLQINSQTAVSLFAQPRGSMTRKERAAFRWKKTTVEGGRKEKGVCIEHQIGFYEMLTIPRMKAA